MFLNDKDIKLNLEKWDIIISDFDEKRLQPASYDILLWNRFLVVKWNLTKYIDPVNWIIPQYDEIILNNDEEFILHPNETVLGVSRDYFWSNNYLIQLSWKSSLARLWLVVHNTAWIINPGHFLNITFELCNFNKVPIILRPNMEIAQILFSKMTNNPWQNYTKTWRFWTWESNFTTFIKK